MFGSETQRPDSTQTRSSGDLQAKDRLGLRGQVPSEWGHPGYRGTSWTEAPDFWLKAGYGGQSSRVRVLTKAAEEDSC